MCAASDSRTYMETKLPSGFQVAQSWRVLTLPREVLVANVDRRMGTERRRITGRVTDAEP